MPDDPRETILPADAPVAPARTSPLPPVTLPSEKSSLSAEEQMALFEKELKENDWGHQPC